MADEVAVIFSAQIGQLIEGVSQVKEAILSIDETVAGVRESLMGFGEAFLAAFAVEKIDEFFSHFAELATQTQRNAALLGVPTEQIAGLDAAARDSGISLDVLVQSMARLGASLANADAGSLKARAGLQALGISVKEFQALDPQAQLAELAEKFSGLKDGIDKDAIAMAVMGRAGAQMIPLLNEGADSLKDFQAMAERTGSTMSKEVVAGLTATDKQLLELSLSFRGLGLTIVATFKPAFDGIVKVLTDVVQGFNNAVKGGGDMALVMNTLGAAARGVATALAVAVAAIETLWTAGKAVVTALANDFKALGGVIMGAMTFDKGELTRSWADLMAANKNVAIGASAEMTRIVRNMTDELAMIWGKGANAVVEAETQKSARLKILNKDTVAAAISAAQEQIKAADLIYQQQVEKINSQAALMQISERQKTEALLAALDVRHNAEIAALNQEAQIQGLNRAQYQKLQNDREQMDLKYASDHQRIVDQAAQQEEKEWKSAADGIASAFNSQLKGLLAGTTSFSQAMKSIFGDLVIKIIESVDKWVLEWIASQARVLIMGNATKVADVGTTVASEAAKTTAVTTGAAARATAESTGASVGIVAQIGNALAVITADAAKTFAGVFAFLSPAMGPAAAGPATASAAAVEASAAGLAVPGLAVGTNMVLSDGLAYLHSGEAVQPASVVGGGYNGGGGGNSLVFAPNFSGFIGTQAMINQIMPQIARGLRSYQNLNPSTA